MRRQHPLRVVLGLGLIVGCGSPSTSTGFATAGGIDGDDGVTTTTPSSTTSTSSPANSASSADAMTLTSVEVSTNTSDTSTMQPDFDASTTASTDTSTTAAPPDLDASGESADASGCGNGIVDPGEECDDGNADDTDACPSTCVPATCGDGFINPAAGEECDDGNQSLLDNCYPTCKAPSLLVFVTSQRYTGNLGGTVGADAKCQGLAVKAGHTGTFKAWLWTKPTMGPAQTFYQSPGKYKRPDKVIIALNFAHLMYGVLLAAPGITETGGTVFTDEDFQNAFWTGLKFDACMDWSASPQDNDPVGGVAFIDQMYIGPGIGPDMNYGTAYGCNAFLLPILCVQQAWYPEPK